jgi:hypothetical protein
MSISKEQAVDLICRLHEVGQTLDRCVAATDDPVIANLFREYSNTVYAAAARISQLAASVNESTAVH